jgi:hypothetical protein
MKLVRLQPALVCPPPEADAETHFTLMADIGTVMQSLNVAEVVPTIKVHVRPLFPCLMFQVIVATEPPAMLPPGLFAVNGIVSGKARNSLTAVNPPGRLFWLVGGKAGMGWRVFAVGF